MSKDKDDENKFTPRIIDGGKLHQKESKKKKPTHSETGTVL